MISQEKFHELEMQYGCGYWNVCWEHACPCAITTENKGLQESKYNRLIQEAKESSDILEKECLEEDLLYFIDCLEWEEDEIDEDFDDEEY
jgi:hypothetical protein